MPLINPTTSYPDCCTASYFNCCPYCLCCPCCPPYNNNLCNNLYNNLYNDLRSNFCSNPLYNRNLTNWYTDHFPFYITNHLSLYTCIRCPRTCIDSNTYPYSISTTTFAVISVAISVATSATISATIFVISCTNCYLATAVYPITISPTVEWFCGMF
jgi:hypothetical protein